MPGLCILKLYPIVIESLAGDDSHTVVVLQLNVLFIDLSDPFYGQSSFTGRNSNPQLSLQVVVNRSGSDLRRESPCQILPEIVVIQDQGLAVQGTEPLNIQ